MLRRIFEFNRAEKNGMLVLIILIGIVIGLNFMLPYWPYQKTESFDHEAEYQQFLALLKKKNAGHHVPTEFGKETPIHHASNKPPATYFRFDPNTATLDELRQLNFNNFQINNLQKYLNAGGKIYEKSDLLKIYGIDSTFYQKLLPYISISNVKQSSPDTNPNNSSKKEEKIITIDINKADQKQLRRIPGIGPKRSETMIKYRDILGGYYAPTQYKEVYGIPDSIINTLEKSLVIDTTAIHHINLNQASFKDLVRHPYISDYQTKSILKYRDMQKDIHSARELYENNVIDSITWTRVRPYLRP